jgi:hypothetical protein
VVYAIIALACALVYALSRAISYYGATLGLLQYLGTKHGDMLSKDKVEQLTEAALERRARELFRG